MRNIIFIFCLLAINLSSETLTKSDRDKKKKAEKEQQILSVKKVGRKTNKTPLFRRRSFSLKFFYTFDQLERQSWGSCRSCRDLRRCT